MPWDQTDDNGQQVPLGTYSFQITYSNEDFSESFGCCPTVTIAPGVPALSTWALAILAGLLGVVGITIFRWRGTLATS